MSGPCVDGTVNLTPGAEREFQLEAERVGGYAIDPDTALRSTYASNFLTDCRQLLVAADLEA